MNRRVILEHHLVAREVDMGAMASVFLSDIARNVRTPENRIRRVAALGGKERDADAHSDREAHGAEVKAITRCGVVQRGCDGERALFGCVQKKARELVAAETSEGG